MSAPTSDLCIFAGVFAKLWRIPRAQTVLEQHVHAHPHISLLCQGEVRVYQNGAARGHHAPALIKVAANVPHYFVSLTDDVVIACIHAVGEADTNLED